MGAILDQRPDDLKLLGFGKMPEDPWTKDVRNGGSQAEEPPTKESRQNSCNPHAGHGSEWCRRKTRRNLWNEFQGSWEGARTRVSGKRPTPAPSQRCTLLEHLL